MKSMLAPLVLALVLQAPAAEAQIPPTEQIMQEAARISSQATSPFAKSLLAGFGCLPPPGP